jgi:hypothetical protein
MRLQWQTFNTTVSFTFPTLCSRVALQHLRKRKFHDIPQRPLRHGNIYNINIQQQQRSSSRTAILQQCRTASVSSATCLVPPVSSATSAQSAAGVLAVMREMSPQVLLTLLSFFVAATVAQRCAWAAEVRQFASRKRTHSNRRRCHGPTPPGPITVYERRGSGLDGDYALETKDSYYGDDQVVFHHSIDRF